MAIDLSKVTILIVEDMSPMLKLTSKMLEALGVGEVICAENGKEGYDLFQEIEPDIVITDWAMEDVDGIALTRRIRTDKENVNRAVPIIMLTGFDAEHRVTEARDAGVTEFLAKPFTATELAKRIAHVINHPRDFVEFSTFTGPDRRRHDDPGYEGPCKRISDADSDKAEQK